MNNFTECFSCLITRNTTLKNGIPICQDCLNQNANQISAFEKNKTKISPEIDQIVYNKLYLGNYDTARTKEVLDKYKITHILICGKYMEKHFEDSFGYLQLDLEDIIEEDITRFFEVCYNFIQNSGRVFIHCNAGVSRSPSIVISYIMKKNNVSFKEAYEYVKSCRPCIFPNESFVEQLKSYEAQLSIKK